jgi:TPR repeat protein
VAKDPKKAVEYYRKCAESGNAKAKSNLGRVYAYGIGVDKDVVMAWRWLKESKDAGEVTAVKLLGDLELQMNTVQRTEAERLMDALKEAKKS